VTAESSAYRARRKRLRGCTPEKKLRSDQELWFTLTSDQKGCGRQIFDTVVGAVPEDWFLAVYMDWSGGMWQKTAQE
jgi:hypothetical protein